MADNTDIGGSNSAPCCKDLTTKELIKIVNNREAETPSFVLNAFYQNIRRFDSDKVEIQSRTQKADRTLAPFVCPCVEGKPNESLDGWDSLTITPAYVKQKDALNACHKALAVRGFGEDCQSRFSRRQRRDIHLSDLLGRQVGRIMRREEWMGIQGILKGGYEVSGDRYPARLVRMPRWDDALNIDKINYEEQNGGCSKTVLDYRIYEFCNPDDLWNNCNVDLTYQIEEIVSFMFDNADATVTDVIVGKNVARCIRQNKSLRELIKCGINQLGSTDVNFGFERPIASQQFRFLGEIIGGSGLRFWQSTGTFTDVCRYDDAGVELPRDQWFKVETPIVPDDVAVFIDNTIESGLDGTRFYGAIMDLDWDFATDGPQSRFVKRWTQPDPSCWHFMTQSAPLMLPCNANAALAVGVCTSDEKGLCLKPKAKKLTEEEKKVANNYGVSIDGRDATSGYVVDQKITDANGKPVTAEEFKAAKAVTRDQYRDAGGQLSADVSAPPSASN